MVAQVSSTWEESDGLICTHDLGRQGGGTGFGIMLLFRWKKWL